MLNHVLSSIWAAGCMQFMTYTRVYYLALCSERHTLINTFQSISQLWSLSLMPRLYLNNKPITFYAASQPSNQNAPGFVL